MNDVVVVGAGPVGLTLALGLLRRGVDVVVLEKNAATAEHSRAPGMWSPTQEILAELGVLDRFEREAIAIPRLELWDADRDRLLLRLPIEELRDETPYARLLIIPQSRTERLLLEEAGPAVRFSSEVVGLEQSGDGVDVRYRNDGVEKHIRARFVAGCDGAHSKVREEIGGSLEGITYRTRVALADVMLEGPADFRFPRLTTRPAMAIGIRMGRRLWRLILPFARGEEQRVDATVKSLFGRTEYEVVWQSEFQLHRRISSRWQDRRVVLAGDAAHLNSPVGGQGMNAGMIDAAALTEALTAALKMDELQALSGYVEQRRRAISGGVNRFTDRLTRVMLGGRGRLIRPLIGGARLVLRLSPIRRRLLRRLSMLDQR